MIKIPVEDLKNFDRRSCVLPYRANFPVRWVFWERWKHAIRLAKLRKEHKMIDVGCGGGFAFPELATHVSEIFGIDMFIDKEMSIFFEKYDISNKVQFWKGDIRNPFSSQNCFDVAFVMDVLEHMVIGDAKKTVQNIKDVVKNKGKIIVSIPTENQIYIHLAKLTRFKKISMKEPHYLKCEDVEDLFSDLKLIGKADIPLVYPFCLYKIRAYEVNKDG